MIKDEALKEIELSILSDVMQFCHEHNIEFYLAFGTLLGAVRHKGFIPWDDDIDIAMPRKAYNLFVQTYCSSNKRYKVVDSALSFDYPYAFAKVIDTHTTLKEQTNSGFPLGVYIDIFPIDALSVDTKQNEKYLRKAKRLCLMARYKLISLKETKNLKKLFFYAFCKVLLLGISQRKIVQLQNKHAVKYDAMESATVCMPTILAGCKEYQKKWLGEGSQLPFENLVCHVPENYDAWLKKQYGDYMLLPPLHKRTSLHNFSAEYKGDNEQICDLSARIVQ